MAVQSLSIPVLSAPEAAQDFVSLTDCARMEFHAALQLLADRAAFVTAASGVAIALRERESFVYRVATGTGVPEPESTVQASDETVRRCLCKAAPVRMATQSEFKLLAAVKQGDNPVGFMELSAKCEFSDDDVNTVARLAELAGVALEHLRAAENADARFWERLQEPVMPKLWHAPDDCRSEKSNTNEDLPERVAAEVHLCSGCGFPVSPGRKLCVECEQKPDAAVPAPAELFAPKHQPSWLSEHGYTIASIIVSAVAAAIIFWLRR